MKTCFLFLVIALVLSGCSQTDPAIEKAIRSALGKPKGNISAEDMESLTKLTLKDSQLDITDTGLAQLKGMSNLRELDLHSIKLTDAGLAHLESLSSLENLQLSYDVTDAGLVHLSGLSNLTNLVLSYFKMTASGVTPSKGAVTDAGLVHLKGLTKLKTLVLRNTQVTDKGREELRQAIPGLKIN